MARAERSQRRRRIAPLRQPRGGRSRRALADLRAAPARVHAAELADPRRQRRRDDRDGRDGRRAAVPAAAGRRRYLRRQGRRRCSSCCRRWSSLVMSVRAVADWVATVADGAARHQDRRRPAHAHVRHDRRRRSRLDPAHPFGPLRLRLRQRHADRRPRGDEGADRRSSRTGSASSSCSARCSTWTGG